MKKRANRRSQLEKIKKKVKKYYHTYSKPEKTKKIIGILANTKTPCSCYMCRNPRRNGEKTMQEKLSDLRFHEEVVEDNVEPDCDENLTDESTEQ